jgi:wyosine [tRNA(Phe)-imidazoG37] synthetase (radical SAM superfamily)
MTDNKQQAQANLNSLLATEEITSVAAGSSITWQQLPSYEEAAAQLEPPDINIAGVRRPPQEQWHLFTTPDHAERKLTAGDERYYEQFDQRITNEGNVVTHGQELADRKLVIHVHDRDVPPIAISCHSD